MARKTPPKDTQFKPGQSGNPGGRPATPPDLLKARNLNKVELERVFNRLIAMSQDQLKELVTNPATPMFELMVASIIAQGAKRGDQQRLDFILNRLVGKVQDKVEVTMPKPFVVVRGSGEQVVMGVEKKDEE